MQGQYDRQNDEVLSDEVLATKTDKIPEKQEVPVVELLPVQEPQREKNRKQSAASAVGMFYIPADYFG